MDSTHARCRAWIQDEMAPLAVVLATEDANRMCAANNLTFCDMLAYVVRRWLRVPLVWARVALPAPARACTCPCVGTDCRGACTSNPLACVV